jgi:hypothetical protein
VDARQILNVILPGDIVGLPGSFYERAVYSVTAITDLRMNVEAQEVSGTSAFGHELPSSHVRPEFDLHPIGTPAPKHTEAQRYKKSRRTLDIGWMAQGEGIVLGVPA